MTRPATPHQNSRMAGEGVAAEVIGVFMPPKTS